MIPLQSVGGWLPSRSVHLSLSFCPRVPLCLTDWPPPPPPGSLRRICCDVSCDETAGAQNDRSSSWPLNTWETGFKFSLLSIFLAILKCWILHFKKIREFWQVWCKNLSSFDLMALFSSGNWIKSTELTWREDAPAVSLSLHHQETAGGQRHPSLLSGHRRVEAAHHR